MIVAVIWMNIVKEDDRGGFSDVTGYLIYLKILKRIIDVSIVTFL